MASECALSYIVSGLARGLKEKVDGTRRMKGR